MALSELKEGMSICDPACGVGKFPLEFVKDNLEKLFKVQNGEITQKVKIIGFDKGFDKDEQKTIAEKYRKVEEIKNNIQAELKKIENIKVDVGL